MPPPAMGRERPGKGPVDLFSEQPAAAGSQGVTEYISWIILSYTVNHHKA